MRGSCSERDNGIDDASLVMMLSARQKTRTRVTKETDRCFSLHTSKRSSEEGGGERTKHPPAKHNNDPTPTVK
jgi:hypothetical protein